MTSAADVTEALHNTGAFGRHKTHSSRSQNGWAGLDGVDISRRLEQAG